MITRHPFAAAIIFGFLFGLLTFTPLGLDLWTGLLNLADLIILLDTSLVHSLLDMIRL